MPRPRSKPVQPSLALEPQDLVWEVIEKVRSSGMLSIQEMELLERAVAGELEPPRREKGWQTVVDCWFTEFEKATGDKPPRPTNTEMRMLMTALKRSGAQPPADFTSAEWPPASTST